MSVVDPDDPLPSDDSGGGRPARDPRLDALLDAIARGRPIDWPKVQAELQLTDSQIEAYRILAAIAAAKRDADGAMSLGDVFAAAAAASTQPPIDPATAGTPWGPLRRIERLDGGHFGDVYRAYDPALEKTVALKILRVPDASPAARRRATADGRLLARIRHPNVVTVHGAGEFGGEVGVWMDFIQGHTLDHIVRSEGPFSGAETLTIGACLCDALAAAHQQGVLHRDIKAANAMREKGGAVVLIDFGIGTDIVSPDGAGEGVAGTPLYMAPELFRRAPASVQTDIYSLGVLLFFLVTGDFPVVGDTYLEVEAKHARGARVRLADVRAGLPRQLLHIVEKATAYDPADRYTSAGAMLADFGVHTETAVPAWHTPSVVAPMILFLVAAGPYVMGQLTTTAYNMALDRTGQFGADSVVDVWRYGQRLLIPPLVYALVLVLAYRGISGICTALADSSRLARVHLVQRAVAACHRIPRALAGRRPQSLADLLVFTQVATTVAVCWAFWDVVSAATSKLNDTDPALLAPLRYGGMAKHAYQFALCALVLGSVTAWTRLIARRGIRQAGIVNTGIGIALVGLLLALLALPWRLIYANTSQRVTYLGMRCYVTAQAPPEVLLYCPDAPRGKKVRTVTPGPDFVPSGEYESIFTPADSDGATP